MVQQPFSIQYVSKSSQSDSDYSWCSGLSSRCVSPPFSFLSLFADRKRARDGNSIKMSFLKMIKTDNREDCPMNKAIRRAQV